MAQDPCTDAPPADRQLWDPYYDPYVARALATSGGHLMIGPYGCTLWFGYGSRLSGGDEEALRTACLAAGLPVIDTRGLSAEARARLVLGMPLVAVGEAADDPPWHGLSRVPLAAVAALYRAAGAQVLNLPEPPEVSEGEGS